MNAKIVIRGDREIDYISSFLQAELSARKLLEEDSNSSTAIPLSLQVDKNLRLGAQGFQIDWMPSIDPAEIFDPEFTWHGDENSTSNEPPEFTQRPPSGSITANSSDGLFYGALEFLDAATFADRCPSGPSICGERHTFRSARRVCN